MSSETPFNREDCIAVKKIKLIDTQYEDKDEFLKIHIHDYGDASIYIETLNDKKAFIEKISDGIGRSELFSLLENSGALAYVRKEMDRFVGKGLSCLKCMGGCSARDELTRAAEFVLSRCG